MGFFERAFPADEPPVRLPVADPELFEGLDPAALRQAQACAVVPAVRLEPGSWDRDAGGEASEGCLGMLVLDGLLLRSVRIHCRPRSELVGPGDVVRRREGADPTASLPFETEWTAVTPARLAVLDARFLAVAGRWPPVLTALMGRALRRSGRLALQLAIADLRRIEDRLLLLFWHLADRWGSVRSDGVLVPVPVTHEVLGRLVAAQRPTVTAGLQRLARSGHLRRRDDKTWLLNPRADVRVG